MFLRLGMEKDDYRRKNEDNLIIFSCGKSSYSQNIEFQSSYQLDSRYDYNFFQVGRFTSIGSNCKFLVDINHDYNSVYQGVIYLYGTEDENVPFRKRVGQKEEAMQHQGMIMIGSDVWIGDGVTIISDVTIGDGAVIAAGSVVVSDVLPYTIYGGNPARFIKYRFPEEIAEKMLGIRWWAFDDDTLKNIENDMKGDVTAFVEKYEKNINYYPKNPEIINSVLGGTKPIFVTFLDTSDTRPVYFNIIDSFCRQYPSKEAELIIAYYMNSENDCRIIENLIKYCGTLPDGPALSFLAINEDEDEAVISQADVLICNRNIKNIDRFSFALKYKVKCISGCNKPIFSKKVLKKIGSN